MVMPDWNVLPHSMRNERVRKYYDVLCKKRRSLIVKRAFDIVTSLMLLILLMPAFICIAILIMMATLLMPAGITSVASLKYKDEDRLLENADDADRIYIKRILPDKMRYNLRSLKRFSLIGDLCTMVRTILEVFM